VSEIGFAVGFSSHAYFTARFRQRFGMTPSAFRARAGARAGALPAGPR
jgi:AraC-like DNA-binding protein